MTHGHRGRGQAERRPAVVAQTKGLRPLFYGTVVLSALILVGKELAPTWREFREVRGLARRLRDPSPKVREEAADRLAEVGPMGASALLDATRDPSPAVRILACQNLLRLNDPDRALPALVAALGDDQAAVRREAASLLGAAQGLYGTAVRPEHRLAAMRVLAAALGDGDAQVRWQSAFALERFGPSARPVVPDLLRALADGDRDVRYFAAEALLHIDPATRDRAIPVLLDLVADPDPSLNRRDAAIEAIERFDPGAEAGAIPALAALLGHGDRQQRNIAIRCLWRIGARSRAALPALRAALADEDHVNRTAAAEALLRLDPEDAAPALETLIDLIADPELHLGTRNGAIRAVRMARPGAEARAVPTLIAQLGSKDAGTRRAAILVLGQIGRPAQAALPALCTLARDEADPLRIDARLAVDWIKSRAPGQGQ